MCVRYGISTQYSGRPNSNSKNTLNYSSCELTKPNTAHLSWKLTETTVRFKVFGAFVDQDKRGWPIPFCISFSIKLESARLNNCLFKE